MGRGVSIHVGLNKLSKNHYSLDGELQFKGLKGCVHDANLMERIAESQGFTERKMFVTKSENDDEQPKAKEILDLIKFYATDNPLGQGDIFMFTFSGHGSQIRNFSGDSENENLDQTWCLFDRMVIDDEFARLWSLFHPDVRIIFSLGLLP